MEEILKGVKDFLENLLPRGESPILLRKRRSGKERERISHSIFGWMLYKVQGEAQLQEGDMVRKKNFIHKKLDPKF
ncbi:MAG: hypothetical protein N3A56_01500 [Thermodesulfobacteriaceae bacterium]|nr:hypothetical protein [Thermodesulfobacteriaceae bacterium]